MRRREFILASASVVGATSIGAVAFTTASVDRGVAVDIVADDAGPIGLNAGSTSAVTIDGDGQLLIDTNTANANGLNGDGSFTYGDDSAASATHAFSMTNNGGGSRDYTFALGNFGTLGGSSSITLKLYDSADAQISGGDVTTSTDQTATVAAGATLYAVLTFDTSGLADTASMNGDLAISAITTP